MRATIVPASVLVACAASAACKDPAAVSVPRAGEHATWLASRADSEVRATKAALPGAAASLAARFAGPDDPRGDVTALHDALVHARTSVPALDAGPSTFFAVLDATGTVLRNDLVIDEMAGQDFFALYPGLAGSKTGAVVTVAPAGNDEEWLTGLPVGGDAELVTGFAYRGLAARLSGALKALLEGEARDAGRPDSLPVFYVAVFDSKGVYPAVHTPPLDENALRTAGLLAKTESGPLQVPVTIAGRLFGLGAARTPELGDQTGIAVLRSEI